MSQNKENLPADAPTLLKQLRWFQLHWKEHWKLIILAAVIFLTIPAYTFIAKIYDKTEKENEVISEKSFPASLVSPLEDSVHLVEEVLDNYREWLERDIGEYNRLLLAEVSVEYKSPAFNIQSYLRKVSRPSIDENMGIIDSREILSEHKKSNTNLFLIKINDSLKMRMELKIVVNNKTNVLVPLESIRWEVKELVDTKKNPPKFKFHALKILLTINDPDFPLIRSARLIEAVPDGTYLLDLVIENHSNVDLPLNNISFISKKRSSIFCGVASSWQPIYLNWSRIDASHDEIEAQASSILGGEQIAVSAKFRGACTDGFNTLKVEVPIVTTIISGKAGRLGFKFVENENDFISIKNLPTKEVSIFSEMGLIDTLHF